MSRIALDTNILIYLHDTNESNKRRKANELIASVPVISAQVISEYLNVSNKRLKMTKQDSLDSLISWLPYCEFALFEPTIYTNAIRLMQKYQFKCLMQLLYHLL